MADVITKTETKNYRDASLVRRLKIQAKYCHPKNTVVVQICGATRTTERVLSLTGEPERPHALGTEIEPHQPLGHDVRGLVRAFSTTTRYVHQEQQTLAPQLA